MRLLVLLVASAAAASPPVVDDQADAGATISGVAIDGIARGIAGARVFCEAETTVADANGQFSIGNLAGGRHEIYAVTATLASPVGFVDVAANEHVRIELVLAEHSLAGTVVDARGQPVVAHVLAEAMFSLAAAVTESDAAGHFDFGGVPPGAYEVAAYQGHGPAAYAHVDAGERHVELALPEAGAVAGRVRFRGNPIRVFAIAVSGYPVPVYARDGRFGQHDLNPGPTDVTIIAAGFMPRHFAFTLADGQTIDLGNIELRRGRTVRGRALDAHGFAVAHAIVRLSYDGNFDDNRRTLEAIWLGHLETETDGEGNFAIAGIDPARAGLLEVRAGELRSRRRPLDEDLLIVEATGGITGAIALRTSDQVHVTASSYASEIARDDKQHGTYASEIARDGSFHFAHLPAGEYAIDVDARPSEHVIVVAGEDAPVTIAAPRDPVLLTVETTMCNQVTLRVPGEIGATVQCHEALAQLPAVSAGHYEVCVDGVEPCAPVELPFEPLRQRIAL